MDQSCPLCGREVALTFHHLIPKKVHGRNYFKKKYSRHELREGIDICRQCHDGLHDFYDEMRLGKEFNSLAAIQADPALIRHFAWVSKQKAGT
ncbi:MAG: hypothetical protein HKN36_04435 [Hellea sp.]|nr:hypothetical protein [Hellea sp.]